MQAVGDTQAYPADTGATPREPDRLAPLASPDIKLAVGEANGRVSILSFNKQPREQRASLEEDAEDDEDDGGTLHFIHPFSSWPLSIAAENIDIVRFSDYIVKQFVPRSNTHRAVNDVAWNRAQAHENLIAAAYEKARSILK